MNRFRIAAAAAFTVVLGLMAFAPSAGASFHLMKIRAFFQGPTVQPNLAYVELQMTADGQNLVAGHPMRVCPPAGNICSAFNLSANVPIGQNQRTVLIGDVGVTNRDITAAGLGSSLQGFMGGGALCFDNVDCVSWGNYTGTPSSPTGTPIAGGLPGNQVTERKITAGCATALDEPDDTNSSAADFQSAVGRFGRPNSAVPTEKLCPKKKKKCKKKKKKAGSGAAAAKKKKCKKKKK